MAHNSTLDRPSSDYLLFRRAILHKDQDAWNELYELYTPWLRAVIQAKGVAYVNADAKLVAELSHIALSKFWHSFTAEKFLKSSNLASILAYLKCCALSALQDWGRQQQRAQLIESIDDEGDGAEGAAPERDIPDSKDKEPLTVILHIEHERERRSVWDCLWNHCKDDDERFLLRGYLVEHKGFDDLYDESPERWGRKMGRLSQCWRNYKERKFEAACEKLLHNWIE